MVGFKAGKGIREAAMALRFRATMCRCFAPQVSFGSKGSAR